MARAIDADNVLERIENIAQHWQKQGKEYEAMLVPSVMKSIIDSEPTLTPPNAWISVENKLPGASGKYMVCAKDCRGARWTVCADWSAEMKSWFGEFGEIKNKVTHWVELPAPPESRPPEGEKDT